MESRKPCTSNLKSDGARIKKEERLDGYGPDDVSSVDIERMRRTKYVTARSRFRPIANLNTAKFDSGIKSGESQSANVDNT